MQEEMDSIVYLVDEDGREVKFEHIITIEHGRDEYAMLVPLEGLDEDDEEALVVLKIVPGKDGEDDRYEGVEDEKLLALLYEKYLEQVEFLDD